MAGILSWLNVLKEYMWKFSVILYLLMTKFWYYEKFWFNDYIII